MRKKQMNLKLQNDVYLVGDIHGDTSVVEYLLQSHNLENLTLIFLGDIGIFRYRDYKRYIKFDQYCKEHNIMVYALRGNHDNPGFFKEPEHSYKIAKRFWDKFTNFKPLPDFSIIEYNNFRGLVLGGGTSIDRIIRRSYSSYKNSSSLYSSNDWWSDETIANIGELNEKYDFILSHTGPRSPKLSPLTENNCNFFKYDPLLHQDLEKENKFIEKIQRQLQPTRWWYGHYHINDNFDFKNTNCRVVDINYLTPLIL